MRRRSSGRGDVYALLLADQRASWSDVRARLGFPDKPNPLVERMERGEPVEVHAWMLPGQPSHYGLHPDDDVIVGPDGVFEVVRPEIGSATDVIDLGDARRRLQGPEVR